ncbi:hypothetical protein [Ralstonia pseudosolanacearum]|nr:hypothetical protein [Ralstonia pseudosolanacearum]
MSGLLKQACTIVLGIPGQTVSGGDQRQHVFGVRNLIAFLEARWSKRRS